MKILFLQKRILFPADVGGKIRTLNVLRHLARWHDVTYLCNVQASEEEHLSAMRELGVKLITVPWRETPRGTPRFYCELARNVVSRYPFNVAKDYDPRLRDKASQLLREETFDLLICDFVQMALNAMDLPGPPKLLFQHNVEAEIFRRHATVGPGWFRRKYMWLQWRKMSRFEARAGGKFDSVVAVSERDRETFQRDYGWSHTHTIDTAVDTDYFQPNGRPQQPDRLMFLGSLDWLPNADGVRFFVREVWPLIREARPRATFCIVGRNPDAGLLALHGKEGIEVAANVPDVRPHLADASVVVVPLLVGGGTRLKIFEAMAMEKAVVSTPLGAEGLPVQPGRHIELAEQPEDFAAAVVHLLTDDARRRRLGREALAHVTEHYSAESVARQFERICRETAAGQGQEIASNPANQAD